MPAGFSCAIAVRSYTAIGFCDPRGTQWKKTLSKRGTTLDAGDSKDYSNLWLITLNDSGECTEFIEYWMEHD